MSDRRSGVDVRAVGAGMLAAAAIAIPAVVAAQVLDSVVSGGVGAAAVVVIAVVVLAFGVAGAVAARRRGAAPLVHGALSGLGAYGVVQTVAMLRLVVAGDEIAWVAVPLFGMVAAAAGLVGAMVADARARR